MKPKTASLTYPKNPLAAMRDLQNLNAEHSPSTFEEPEVTSEAPTTSSQVTHATSSEVSNATSSVVASEVKKKQFRREAVNSPDPKEDSGNPLDSVLIELLGKPYVSQEGKGPFTISTVKVQTEISERLGYAATLTKRPKQEIIGEALKDYFKKILRGQ